MGQFFGKFLSLKEKVLIMADNEFLPKLSQNLLEILNDDDEYYDIQIEVGKDPYVKIFRAHDNFIVSFSLFAKNFVN